MTIYPAPRACLAVSFSCAALLFAPHGNAIQALQTFTVNSTLDLIDDNTGDNVCHTAANTCTLRAAVMQANRSLGEGATINLPAGTYTLTISPSGTRGDDNGDLDLTTPSSGNPVVSIVGTSAASTIIDANLKDRAFYVHAGRTAIISGVTVRNGYAGFEAFSDGGGIRNDGTLTLSGSTISGNTGYYFGGGIRNDGALSVILSAISGNVAGNGGGISNGSGGSLFVMKSTLSGNLATNGGGINNGGTLYLSQSTLSGNGGHGADSVGGGILNFGALFVTDSTLSLNSVNADGGGIYDQGTSANIYNSTIAYNDADSDANSVGYGGGVYIVAGFTLNIRNSLLVGNYVRGDPVFHSDCWGDGTLVPYGLNFTTTIGVCNVSNGSWSVLNSLTDLGPLQNNGGPTQTIALLNGSNAIDVGDPTFGFDCLDQNSDPILTDQRGFTRPAGYFCDIGAFEYGAVNPMDEIFKNGFE